MITQHVLKYYLMSVSAVTANGFPEEIEIADESFETKTKKYYSEDVVDELKRQLASSRCSAELLSDALMGKH